MNGENALHRFQFQDYLAFNCQIHFVSTIKQQAFVKNGQVHLPVKGHPAKVQLVAQTFFIC